jgi:lipopolysaccharide/colanic/teichoic acid biosynthesis glycosyltransferase
VSAAEPARVPPAASDSAPGRLAGPRPGRPAEPAISPLPPTADGLPYPIDSGTLHLIRTYDWAAVLPARATGWRWRAAQRLKRFLDLAVASALLVVLAPVYLVTALAVRLSGPGPILYPWKVLGRNGRPFVGYKFRTMVPEAEALKPKLLERNEMRGPVFKMREDPRVTTIGRWLRKYSVDELPQLWSVLKGDMSLVGPRPCSAEEFARFEPWQRAKLAVTPGITCLWQVEGRNEITDFEEWARLDLRYIRQWTLRLDLGILARTLPAVLRGRGAY